MPAISPTRRAGVILGVALACGVVAQLSHPPGQISDLTQLLQAGELWWSGVNPYDGIGPGRTFPLSFKLLYPFTAVVTALPLTMVPWPDGVFVAVGVGMWGFAIARHSPPAWWALGCWAGWHVVRFSQWEALLSGAALLGWPGFLLACKPHVGAALFAAYPTRSAALGALALIALSLVLLPEWPLGWLDAIQSSHHFKAPVQHWGGPLILLAATEWQRPQARLLLAMGCMPQTPLAYGIMPLFLVPRTHGQGAAMCISVMLLSIVHAALFREALLDFDGLTATLGALTTLLVYLPCTWMVLEDGRLVRWARATAAGLRGQNQKDSRI